MLYNNTICAFRMELSTNQVREIQTYIDQNQRLPPREILNNLEEIYRLPNATLFSIVNQKLRTRCAISGKKLRKIAKSPEL